MGHKTQGFSLQAVLDHVFADQVRHHVSGCANHASASTVVPATRTAEDRSRMKQRVLEELAYRRERAQATVNARRAAPAIAPASSDQSQATLFGLGNDSARSRVPDHTARARASAPRTGGHVRTDVRELVATAYCSLMRRLPEDHVVLNPLANAEFIVRCRELGATVPEVVLNRTLLNNRKAKRHADILREPVGRLATETFEQIRHAVEIAASLVQREWFAVGNVVPSVDDMLCNPDQRRALGVYVGALHDHVDPIDCHLALLAFRKSGREASARSAVLSMPERCLFARLKSLDPDDVPVGGGVYRVLCERRPVFVSSTATLRARLREHLERGGAAFLPESLPFQIDGQLSVEVFSLPKESPRCNYDALTRRLRLKRSEDQVPAPPDLNWRESGALFGSNESVVKRCAMVC